MAVLARPDTAHKVFELGGPRVYTYRELAALALREIDRSKPIIGVPAGLMKIAAFFAEFPAVFGLTPQITRDQVHLLVHDNVVRPGALGLADLGIGPTAAEVILPTYLDRFRVGGRYNQHAPAEFCGAGDLDAVAGGHSRRALRRRPIRSHDPSQKHSARLTCRNASSSPGMSR